MKGSITIDRLDEQVQAIEPPPVPAAPVSPQDPGLMMPDFPALPAGPTSAVDPMTMTVKDFIEKCKTTYPLVAMGIEQFISKNAGNFGSDEVAPPAPVPDITFSSTVPPAGNAAPPVPPESELDFPG